MELNEKDLHCLARMLQGSFCKRHPFFCCSGDCKYSQDCAESISQSGKFHFDEVRKKLCDLTGVWITKLEVTSPPG